MGWGRRWARRALILSTWLLGLVAAMMIAAIVLYQTVADVQRPESLPLAQVATLQYSDGTTLARIGTVDRVAVRLAQVPPHVRWAVLAAEDRGFYSEPGVSLRGTVRAALADATGRSTQGGSGITQQYVKNTYLSDSQTLSRKLKELMISLKLAREYSKDQILEFYLNTVYFGRGAYGIQAAARQFFGVDVAKLTVAQGALLAGMLRAPSYYDPAANPTAARQRWRYVLDGMVATKHLTPAQETALAFPRTRPESGSGLGVSGWKYLVKNAVLADLARHGISDREISERGLTIRTTIDRRAQQAAVRTIATTFGHLTAKQKNLKNALVAVNPRSGGVIAYYGGSGTDVKGYDGRVNYNDWVAQREPAGSAFKPYTLATALNQTVERTPGRPHLAINSYVDGSYCRRIEGTRICNDISDKTVSGPRVRLALAMKYSLNTTFDSLASQVGPANVAATAHSMGVAAKDSSGHPTLVNADGTTTFGIGIGDYPVTPLDQATGFATLANKGVRNDAYLVTTATASDGEVVFRHRSSAAGVLDSRVANDVTNTLTPIAAYSGVALANARESAAKTGTEGIQRNGRSTGDNSDAWMVGFTPQISTAVWVGTGYRKPIYNAQGQPMYGRDLPGRTWKLFMDNYLRGRRAVKFATTQQIAADGGVPSASTQPTDSTATRSTPADNMTSQSTPSDNTPSQGTPSDSTPAGATTSQRTPTDSTSAASSTPAHSTSPSASTPSSGRSTTTIGRSPTARATNVVTSGSHPSASRAAALPATASALPAQP